VKLTRKQLKRIIKEEKQKLLESRDYSRDKLASLVQPGISRAHLRSDQDAVHDVKYYLWTEFIELINEATDVGLSPEEISSLFSDAMGSSNIP